MKNQRRLLKIIAIFIVLSFIVLSGSHPVLGRSDGLHEKLKLFADALVIIQRQHVEEVDIQKLIHGALRGMLATLDPHSQFMDPDLFRELQIQTRGYFGGLGMIVTMKDNFLTVISPLEETPASRAGIQAKDIIIKIGDEPTKDLTLMEAVKKLRGREGTPVTITVVRNRETLPEITLIRERIELPIINEARIIKEGIGYIRLVSFREDTARELGEALRKLEGEGMEALILDLRGNAGGLLGVAVDVADKFLPPGKKIVSTRGRAAADRRDYFAWEEPYTNYPLVVLVDGASASASEIVAGAIQDWNRGIIIGTETFGKASVQTLIPLGDGSVLRLTTAKYFTPQGRSLEDEGIIPDIIVEKAVNEVVEEDLEEKEILDPQLQQALNILKAWPIFRAIYSPGEGRDVK
ncbi:S41 family peptidase [candidate division NPL-UPA2 bacterium]|nr:S41 family peptidase [candidate division NPL-UPA2 bacterium]